MLYTVSISSFRVIWKTGYCMRFRYHEDESDKHMTLQALFRER